MDIIKRVHFKNGFEHYVGTFRKYFKEKLHTNACYYYFPTNVDVKDVDLGRGVTGMGFYQGKDFYQERDIKENKS